jgi:hypothetical protein
MELSVNSAVVQLQAQSQVISLTAPPLSHTSVTPALDLCISSTLASPKKISQFHAHVAVGVESPALLGRKG